MNSGFMRLEWRQMLRSRWLQLVGLLFVFVFTAVMAIQQLALPASSGFSRQAAAMFNVQLFLLPLFLLTIGSMNIAGDAESGWLQLLKTYPMKMRRYISGKYMALAGAFLLIALLSMGAVLAISGIAGDLSGMGVYIVTSLLLIFIFSALALLLGALAKNRLHALALSLVFWASWLLLIPYGLMAAGTVLAGHTVKSLIIFNIHMNPVEWVRFCFFLATGNGDALGPAFYGLTGFYTEPLGVATAAAVTASWIVLPLAFAAMALKRRKRQT
ncbi:ABC transporter permease [Planococcus plakortidis]|uniref:ABC transporter permease n=1 Tax=Planococcus plakortidis TaxID=1038856 RepID=UPI003984AFEF